MSKYMLCDDATINDINPFVVHDFSLPGGVRQTPEFADHTKDMGEKKYEIVYDKLSPICDVAATAGDRTVDFCTGGREPPCPLGRPVHPIRNIDYGFTRDVPRARATTTAPVLAAVTPNMLGFVVFLILTALVVSILRR